MNGPSAAWYRGTQVRHQGHIKAGGVSRDVTFAAPEPGVGDQLDAEYRAKYRRYAASIDRQLRSWPGSTVRHRQG